MRPRLFLASFVALAASASAGMHSFEGSVSASETRGGVASRILYTRRAELLRVETPNAPTPLPINLHDLGTSKLTILYPHNRSFTVVEAEVKMAPANLPTTMPAPPTTALPKISPPPGFPTPPPMPSMPANPMAAGIPGGGMPMMPPMPMIAANAPALELKKTDQTKKIQGVACTLYTLSDRMETMEIWATPDADLFPFQLLQTNANRRHFGPVMLEEEWASLLRKQNLFPLEATIKMRGQPMPRYTFKIEKIDAHKIEDETLFQPPAGYFEAQAPAF